MPKGGAQPAQPANYESASGYRIFQLHTNCIAGLRVNFSVRNFHISLFAKLSLARTIERFTRF